MNREYPDRVEVTIEIPRWSFVKYCQNGVESEQGYIDFVSPLPCPYNYGFVADTTAADGMELDAIVCGSRLPRGTKVELEVCAVIHFVDAGRVDDKLVCHDRPLSFLHFWFLRLSFPVYVVMKRTINAWRKVSGKTTYGGIERKEVNRKA